MAFEAAFDRDLQGLIRQGFDLRLLVQSQDDMPWPISNGNYHAKKMGKSTINRHVQWPISIYFGRLTTPFQAGSTYAMLGFSGIDIGWNPMESNGIRR